MSNHAAPHHSMSNHTMSNHSVMSAVADHDYFNSSPV